MYGVASSILNTMVVACAWMLSIPV
jgi:hypothetical protein